MCTTLSDLVLAPLFSSIILSSPRALAEVFRPFLPRVPEDLDDDECVDPSRLGVGVFDRDSGRVGRGGSAPSLLGEDSLVGWGDRDIGEALSLTAAAAAALALGDLGGAGDCLVGPFVAI